MDRAFAPETGDHSGRRARLFLFCLAIVVACLVLGAVVSVLRGQDASWDLRNYHLYNGWAALHDRLGIDLAAASLQSWINPTLDIPYAWLALGALSNSPRLLAAFMGLWYGALIAVILGVAFKLYTSWPTSRRRIGVAAGTILAATGAATFSQAGMTFNEIQTSILVMSAVLLLMHDVGSNETPRRAIILLFAGVLLGTAMGLKITSAIYGPAATMSFMIAVPPRRWPASLALLLLGGLLGFALGGGWWAYKLYEIYGNPVFPFFNGVFHSPWYPPVNVFDRRFLPRSMWQELFYPFFWLTKERMIVAEYGFRDGRIPIAFALIVISAGLALSRGIAKRPQIRKQLAHPQIFLLGFTVISYVVWLCTTSILRYAIPVEVSAALLIPGLLGIVLKPEFDATRRRIWTACVATVSLGLLAFTRYPAWDHIPYDKHVVDADMSWVSPDSLVVFVGATVSYIAPFVSPSQGDRFLGLTDAVFEARGYELSRKALAIIRSHHGPVMIVWNETDNWRLSSLRDMGLQRIPDTCRQFFGTLNAYLHEKLYVCAARAESPSALPDPFWRRAAQRYDEISVPVPTAGWSYATFVNAVGDAASGKRYVDSFEYLWSRRPGYPKEFDARILPNTLYILNSSLESRARRAMNKSCDLLTRIDGILVLAPGWKITPKRNATVALNRDGKACAG
jgi:hypothetical protein